MSSYGYRPGYSTRPGYTTGSNGVRPYTNEGGQTRYADADEFRTTIVDADGTRRTIIAGTQPAGSYVTKHETIITERVDSPSSPPRQAFEPVRTYGGYPNQSGYNGAAGYGDYSDHHSTNKPYKHSGTVRYDNYGGYPNQSGAAGYGDYSDHYSTYGGYPNQSGAAGYGDYSDHYSTYGGYPNQSGAAGYGDYSDHYSTNNPYKHSGTDRYDNNDDYSHNRKHSGGAMGTAINMIANGSGHSTKPNRGSLLAAKLPVRGDGRLSLPTDDMERALHYLKESSKPKNKYSYK